jgi:hypothetical protein
MRMTLLALATGVLLLGPTKIVRADDSLDDVKRQRKIAADKLEADVKEGLADAAKLARSSPTGAVKILDGLAVNLEIDRILSEERRQELKDLVSSRIKRYRQQAAGTSTFIGGTTGRDPRRRYEEIEQKNAEMAQTRKQAAELYRQGKFKEALEINEQFDRKYGSSPASIAVSRSSRAADALRELREIRDERSDRYRRSYLELMRATLPIVGEVEFPDAQKWRDITKRRTKSDLTDKEKTLLKALSTPVTFKEPIKDQPIQAVLTEIEQRYGITIDLDKRGLDQAQLTPESPVSATARGQTLRSVLKNMLGNAGLTFTIRKGELHVTTPQLAAEDMVVRAYPIGDLLQTAGQTPNFYLNQIQALQSLNALINTIQGIDPQSWESGGGKGTIFFDPARMALIIKQSAEMQFTLQGWMK